MKVLLLQNSFWVLSHNGWKPKMPYTCNDDGFYFERELKNGRWAVIRLTPECKFTAFRYGTRQNPVRGPVEF